MKNQLQNKSKYTKLAILAGVAIAVSAFTTHAQTFIVYEKTEHNHHLMIDPDEVETSAMKFDYEYVIWDIDSGEYARIHLNDDDRTYFTYGGVTASWAWNKLIEDDASGRTFSILSFFGDGEEREDALADTLWGATEEVEIQSGGNVQVVDLARSYVGDGLTKHYEPNFDIHRWTISKFEMKFNDFQTKSVNDGQNEKLSEAIQDIVVHLEREGWRARGE